MTPPDPSTLYPVQPRKRRAGLIVALAGGAAVLVALTVAATIALTSGTKPTVSPRPAAAAAGSTPAAPPTTQAAPSPTPPAVHHFGEEVTDSTGDGRMAVFGFKQPVAKSAPRPDQDGYEWAAADVQVCALADGIFVNRLPWYLIYADHTTINSSGTGYQQFPQPEYPWGDTSVPNGHCVRGWIVFPAPIGKTPVSVQHNVPSSVIDWVVG